MNVSELKWIIETGQLNVCPQLLPEFAVKPVSLVTCVVTKETHDTLNAL